MAGNHSDNNVCFYSNDNYSEKMGGKKFCVPYYTEDEWLFNQWNNNISSIKIPPYLKVDVFSDYSFTGKSATFYSDTNSAALAVHGLTSDISSYRVLPRNIYPDSKRVVFNFHSENLPENYFSYNYYTNSGHSMFLVKQKQPIGIDGHSSYIFYSHAGQIMTAFFGLGFERNLYCLTPTDRRSSSLNADVAFTYCDFNNTGQNWFPATVAEKTVLINHGTGTALSLDHTGFYVSLHVSPVNNLPGRIEQHIPQQITVDENALWFDESTIQGWKENAVRPFLQYKEILESINDNDQRDEIVHHLDEPDDTYIYLGKKGSKRHIYYNAETQSLTAYNKLSDGRELIESSCLSLLDDGTDHPSPVSFTYHRNNYSDNSLEYRCDNGVAYNMYTKRWYFMADWEHHYLVNGHENKTLHFYVNDKPLTQNYLGVLTGPELGALIGVAVNFEKRTPHDAVFINNPALAYLLDVEKGVCMLSGVTDDNGTHCAELNKNWSSIDSGVLSTLLSRYYIPWMLSQVAHKLNSREWTDELNAFLQKVETLETFFEQHKEQPADNAKLQQAKNLFVEFLQNYHSTGYEQVWHQVAYVLNRIDSLLARSTVSE
ncbi:peptidase inhibitor family I36 protein [Yersinia artesiana]|uniref:peptidase inhibitor family I36 protein n=4 Tax=Yersinia artesiana TaxID=2890315 RepID=UPI001F3B84E8|nr:peptidase inhibitor family I36 protein [Yersinia artesiana]